MTLDCKAQETASLLYLAPVYYHARSVVGGVDVLRQLTQLVRYFCESCSRVGSTPASLVGNPGQSSYQARHDSNNDVLALFRVCGIFARLSAKQEPAQGILIVMCTNNLMADRSKWFPKNLNINA